MTVTEERPTGEVGAPRTRKEDARLITGRTTWTENVTLPGMLYLAVLRSPVKRLRIDAGDPFGADVHHSGVSDRSVGGWRQCRFGW